MKSITSILAVLALGTTLAIADDAKTEPATTTTPATTTSGKPHADPAEMFKKLDTNGDGKLTLEEYLASKHAQKDPDKAKAAFQKKDKGNKGYLTLEEFAGHGKKGEAASAAATPAAPAAK
ncbi:MAG TPA: EF-hand domain-containing protein [Chthoniobacter sp.]|jgi:hypothetical protein